MLAASKEERHISRKLTVNIHQHTATIRPIIKGIYCNKQTYIL
jgi:hypothetical protein